jgi:hypothetical protein
MDKANFAFTIQDCIQGHTSQFEQVDFLFVKFRYLFIWIWQAGEGEIVLIPIRNKFFQVVRANRKNFRIAFCELLISVPQAR